MAEYRIDESMARNISKTSVHLFKPLSDAEINKFKQEVRDIVGGPGTDFSINHYDSASAKISALLILSLKIERTNSARQGHEEIQQTIASALLSQMAHGELGTFGVAHFQSFPGLRSKPLKTMSNAHYLRDANIVIARFITPYDLQEKLVENKDAILRTSAPCEDKLDYILSLYSHIRRNSKSDFVHAGYGENQRILIRAAVGQLRYMADIENKAGTKDYAAYYTAISNILGVGDNLLASFMHDSPALERHLERRG